MRGPRRAPMLPNTSVCVFEFPDSPFLVFGVEFGKKTTFLNRLSFTDTHSIHTQHNFLPQRHTAYTQHICIHRHTHSIHPQHIRRHFSSCSPPPPSRVRWPLAVAAPSATTFAGHWQHVAGRWQRHRHLGAAARLAQQAVRRTQPVRQEAPPVELDQRTSGCSGRVEKR